MVTFLLLFIFPFVLGYQLFHLFPKEFKQKIGVHYWLLGQILLLVLFFLFKQGWVKLDNIRLVITITTVPILIFYLYKMLTEILTLFRI